MSILLTCEKQEKQKRSKRVWGAMRQVNGQTSAPGSREWKTAETGINKVKLSLCQTWKRWVVNRNLKIYRSIHARTEKAQLQLYTTTTTAKGLLPTPAS